MNAHTFSYPLLTCEQAKALERRLLTEPSAEWAAMQAAGRGIAQQVVRDYAELRPVPEHLRVLALVGKGHNGGDALLCCGHLLAEFPRAKVTLLIACEPAEMRPLTQRAYAELEGRVLVHRVAAESSQPDLHSLLEEGSEQHGYDICLDGLLGLAFQPPLRQPICGLIEAINRYPKIALRAAVDLPSGLTGNCEGVALRADFSYATGVPKTLHRSGLPELGRVRLIDLGFFAEGTRAETNEFLLSEQVLTPLRELRGAHVDKRSFGHLYIVGGSAFMPGALLMAVQSAVRSGVGLVTAFAPASLASSLAAQVPEAMWVPWPETSNGTLDPRAMPLLIERLGKATALLIGPGMGRDRYSERIAQEIIQRVDLPVVCDADALRQRVLAGMLKRSAQFGPVILTPHMGEYMRIAKLAAADDSVSTLLDFSRSYRVLTVLKGPLTRICDGETVLYNSFGGPVLSRGGSGDLLAGLIGGMLAQGTTCARESVARAVVLHGLAAECLARTQGQVAVRTTQLLDFLSTVLRGES